MAEPAQLTPVLEKPTICIVGDPGAGKTRLASLWPDPFYLDAEGGAASAVPPERRKSFEIGPSILTEVKSELNKLVGLPYRDRRVFLGDMPIGAVVIDSFDALQQVHKYEGLLDEGKKQWKEPRQMWGRLLDDMTGLVFISKKVKVPIIWIAHVKQEDPIYNYDQLKKPGWRGIAAQGSIEEHIMRWFDYVLHLFVEEDFRRTCITQPTIYRDFKITAAKDRHYTFRKLGKNLFPIALNEETGFPNSQALQVIYDRHQY